MKKFAWILGISLLVLTVLVAGCSNTASTSSATTPAKSAATISGPLTTQQGTVSGVNPKTSTVTIETPQGAKPVQVSPSTQIIFQGKACTLDQLASYQDAGIPLDCTVIVDENGIATNVIVNPVPQAQSFRGTISDVNIKDSTVTVKTGSGDKVINVDPETGLLIGGVACSLDLVNALIDAGGNIPCTVIVSTNDQGTAEYIDMTNPPNFTQNIGTVSSVDIQKSTVTIVTDSGPHTFEVDAKTGAFLNGDVCSLQDIQGALNEGATLGSCKVMFYTDNSGNLVYLDINQTPKP